ncbi:Max-binding protein MNT [Frankliniella fusca]|uniref:Max-binding protein MNT n=1 Tax=Frankliniella fusca TaxID=407009 RepID=A0AAE1L8B7_9NEOP|nr:Max-binding protein MNT [Frankliniella fusca]
MVMEKEKGQSVRRCWLAPSLPRDSETPPSHEEFPSTLCSPESLPLVNGRLTAAPSPEEAPLPLSPTPSPVLYHRPPSPQPHLPHLPPQPSPAPQLQLQPTAPPAPPPPQPSVVRPTPTPAAVPTAVPQGSPPPPPPAPAPAPTPGSAPVAAPGPAPVVATGPASVETPDSPTNGSQDDDLLGQESRRRTGSGTREVHNKLEKNRRAHLKECFEVLKRQLPTCQEEKKCSNLSILHAAIRYIQSLRRKERDYEHEMERLAREKISAQQRLASLRKDLAQWDHLDINALYPDCADGAGSAAGANGDLSSRVRLPSPTSTSTASAELEGGMIIDEDDDVDDDDDTMSFHSGRQRSASDSSSAMQQPAPAHSSPGAPGAGPPALRDLHGYRGESPQAPLQASAPAPARARSPVSPRPRTASPVASLRPVAAPGSAAGVLVNGHYADAGVYKMAGLEGRGVSAPSSGFVPAKLVHNYSIKVASPASGAAHGSAHVSSSSSPPASSRGVGAAARVPSSPVGTLTTHQPPAPPAPRSRASPPQPHRTSPVESAPASTPGGSPSPSPGAVLQPLALTSHHIQLPVPAQVVNNGRWLGVSPAILQLTAPPAQRLLVDPAAPRAALAHAQHATISNGRGGPGATPLVTHQRLRELAGGAVAAVAAPASAPPSPHSIGTSAMSAVSTATAAITMPTVHALHANKVLVGEGFHKAGSVTAEGIRPAADVGVLTKGLQLPNEANGHLLTTAVHPGPGSASLSGHVAHVVSTHPSLSPLVTPVAVMSQGSPVTHILAAKNMGKMAPLIKTMPIVSPQYLGAVVKPAMVVVSSASTLPPNSGV